MSNLETMKFPPAPALTHSVNSSGRLGMFVQPHSCPCVGCHDYLASQEPPGLSNLPPRPSALNLERQTAVPHSEDAASDFSPLSRSSSLLSPIASTFLPQRSNGSPPSSYRIPLDLNTIFQGFRESRWEHTDEHTGVETETETAMSSQLHNEIVDHLTQYLTMLEKHQKVMAAKMDLYAFLLEDGSVRLRLDAFNKKINSLKATLGKLD